MAGGEGVVRAVDGMALYVLDVWRARGELEEAHEGRRRARGEVGEEGGNIDEGDLGKAEW